MSYNHPDTDLFKYSNFLPIISVIIQKPDGFSSKQLYGDVNIYYSYLFRELQEHRSAGRC